MGFPGSVMRIAAAALSGLAYPLAFAPLDVFWLAPVTVAVLFLIWAKAPARQAALQGFVFGLGMALAGVSWIYVSIHQYGGASPLPPRLPCSQALRCPWA